MMIPAAACRAIVRVAGRHLARRACRYLCGVDAGDLDVLAREASEFACLMHDLGAGAHRLWRRLGTARLADARR